MLLDVMMKKILNAAAERVRGKMALKFIWSHVLKKQVAFVFFLFNRELVNLCDLGFKYWNS